MTAILDIFLLAAEFLLYPIRQYRKRRHLLDTLPDELARVANQARRTAGEQGRQPFDVFIAALSEQAHLRDHMGEFAVSHMFHAHVTLFRRVDLGTRWSVLGGHATTALSQARGDPQEARRTFLRRLREDAGLYDLLIRWIVKRVLTTLPQA